MYLFVHAHGRVLLDLIQHLSNPVLGLWGITTSIHFITTTTITNMCNTTSTNSNLITTTGSCTTITMINKHNRFVVIRYSVVVTFNIVVNNGTNTVSTTSTSSRLINKHNCSTVVFLGSCITRQLRHITNSSSTTRHMRHIITVIRNNTSTTPSNRTTYSVITRHNTVTSNHSASARCTVYIQTTDNIYAVPK